MWCLPADDLPVGAVVGIVLGVLLFIGSACACVAILFCCCIPSCGCYYKRHNTTLMATTSYNHATGTVATIEPPPPYSATAIHQAPAPSPTTTQPLATITYPLAVLDSPPRPIPYRTEVLSNNLPTANGNAPPDYPGK